MPYLSEWVEPQVAFTVRREDGQAQSIWHVYKNDDFEQPLYYWYSLTDDECPTCEFDIRDLNANIKRPFGPALQALIDAGVRLPERCKACTSALSAMKTID